jgi:uncharacterized membrane protein YidH (DUF202 family)
MKLSNFAYVLIIVGIVMMAFTGFKYMTTEKIVDLGPIQIEKDRNHFVQWPPIIGLVILSIGIVTLIVGNKSKNNS